MGKKKIEHAVFDQMNKTKKSVPFGKMNNQVKMQRRKVCNKGR